MCVKSANHLEFAAQVWSPWLAKYREVLEKVQRRAIIMVSCLKGNSYEERLRELKMTTLEERRHQLDMAQVFKILHGHDSVKKESWFQMMTGNTRMAKGQLNIAKPRARTEQRMNFFSVCVVDNWNKIPSEIKMTKNSSSFKRLYKAYRSGHPKP
jgi:hypothetical protein